jgi:hypothetical protein
MTRTKANGMALWVTSFAAMAPAMAINEPTDKSTPSVAMTKVMPMASSITFEPWLRISTSVP